MFRNASLSIGLMLALSAAVPVSAADKSATPEQLPLAFEENFEEGAARWEPTDAKAWKIVEEDGNKFYAQFQASDYKPEVRSPFNIAWIKDLAVDSFTLEARMRQTGREYGHRDMCIFFGKQDAAHFYYVHIATKADEHANSIFIVNGEPRKSIATERTDGTNWGAGFQTVRVTRNADTGEIAVYFNDMTKPIMKAVDKTFPSGQIGFGTFDDTGDIDDIKIWSNARE